MLSSCITGEVIKFNNKASAFPVYTDMIPVYIYGESYSVSDLPV
jgi:hypothetical protein